MPSPPQRVPKQSRISATAFHKRKSKHANKMESCKAVPSGGHSACSPGIRQAVTADYQPDNEDNNTNRGGHAVGVVVGGAAGKIEQSSSLKIRNSSPAEYRPREGEATAMAMTAAADTIRKRIKFIMGDDEAAEEDAQPQAKASPDSASLQVPWPAAPPSATRKLRLRTSCSTLQNMGSEMPMDPGSPTNNRNERTNNNNGRKTSGGGGGGNQRQRRDRRETSTTRTASTSSNRTRSRFFSRFNKRTIRAVVLLVVKLCGLLVASILIPSSKQLVTAVDSGFGQSEPSVPAAAAPTNLDDEYGEMSGMGGYASSTIIAISPANGNYIEAAHLI